MRKQVVTEAIIHSSSRLTDFSESWDVAEPRPCKAGDLVLIGTDRKGNFVFLSPQGPGWAALTPSAARLLALCDGHRTVSDLEHIFQITAPSGSSETPVRSLVKVFHECCLLQNNLPRPEQRAHRKALQYAALYLTSACNLACRFCFYSAGKAAENELTADEYIRLIDDLAAMGTRTVYLMGGEPLLRRDIFHIADHARARGMVVGLVTNGTLVTREVAHRIAETFSFAQVSLDGLEEANDSIRGRNGFRRTVKGIGLLLDRGCDVRVASVVSQLNANHLDRFLDYVVKLGATTVHFINLQECGRGKTSRIGVPAKEFFSRLIPAWHKWRDVIGRSNALNFLLPTRGFRRTHCGVGNGMVEIDSRGEVFGCYKYMETRVSQDNVRARGIAEIYETSSVLGALRTMSVLDDPACRTCHFRFLCGGDCMAVPKVKGQAGELCEVAELYRWILTEADIPEVRVPISPSDLHI